MSDDNDPSRNVRRGNYAKDKGEVVLREHEYDGIQEFDQKLPNWWLFTFYGAVVWFVAYWMLYYHTDLFRTDQERIIDRVQTLNERKEEELAATLAELDNETLIGEWAADPSVVASGQAIYSTNCVACHAADLSGTLAAGGDEVALPGLPLDDGEWKYGGEPMEIFELINEGTPEDSSGHNGAKMQAWGQMLSPRQIAEVTAYLIAENPRDFGG